MSVIVYNNGLVYSDTAMTTDTGQRNTLSKLVLMKKLRSVVGFTGNAERAKVVIRWLDTLTDIGNVTEEQWEKFPVTTEPDTTVLLFRKPGVFFMVSLLGSLVEFKEKESNVYFPDCWSWGSGADAARAAYMAGASITDSIIISSRINSYVNGKVEGFEYREQDDQWVSA